MKNIFSLWSGTFIVGTALVLASCGKKESPAVAEPARDIESRSAYDKVMPRLDAGGTMLVYLETEGAVKGMEKTVNELKGALGNDLPPEATAAVTAATDLLTQSGLYTVEAFGFSQAVLKNGLFRNKTVLLRESGAEGFGWQLFGAAPRELDMLSHLPATTTFASFTDFDLALLWKTLRDLAATGSFTEMQQGLDEIEQSTAQIGLQWSELLESFDNHFGVLITLDESKRVTIPVGTETIEIPEPAGALVFKMKNDSVYESLKAVVAQTAPVKPVVGEGFEGVMVQMPGESAPFTLTPTLAKVGPYLIVGSTNGLVESIASAKRGGGLVDQASFKELAEGIPNSGNSFFYIGAQANDLIKQLTAGNQEELPPALVSMMEKQSRIGRAFGVNRAEQDAYEGISNSEDGPERLIGSVLVAPVALGAAVAVPSFLRARIRAQATKSMNELRLIDAAIDQYAIENNLTDGAAVSASDLRTYFKPGSDLHTRFAEEIPVDVMGNPYGAFKVGELPQIPAASAEHFSDVAGPDFWAPYTSAP